MVEISKDFFCHFQLLVILLALIGGKGDVASFILLASSSHSSKRWHNKRHVPLILVRKSKRGQHVLHRTDEFQVEKLNINKGETKRKSKRTRLSLQLNLVVQLMPMPYHPTTFGMRTTNRFTQLTGSQEPEACDQFS